MAKQQTYDATKMGPLSWRQLQLANQNYYANLEPGDDLRAIMEANTVKAIPNSGSPELNWEGRVQSPIMRNSNGRDYWGKSMWDEQVADANDFYNNLSDIRGQNQPWYAQLGAGLLKGVTTAATTWLDGTVGLLYGIGAAIGTAFDDNATGWDAAAKIFHNSVSDSLQDFNEFMEEFAPNYKSRDEENNKWYQNMGTMNFWADGLIKNLGFTVGAYYSGAVFSKALKVAGGLIAAGKAGKAAKAYKAAKVEEIMKANPKMTAEEAAKAVNPMATATRYTNTLKAIEGARSGTGIAVAGSLFSAVNEGRIEANQVYRDAFTLGNTPEESKGAAAEILAARNRKMQEIEDDPTLLSSEKQALQAQVQANSQKLLAEAEQNAAKAGMLTLGLNIPILTIDNFKMYGRLYSRGFKQSVKQVSNNVTTQELKAAQEAVKNATTKQEKEAAKRALKEAERKAKAAHNARNNARIDDVAENVTEKEGRLAWNEITKGQAAWRGIKQGLMEGNEEMMQAWASGTAGNMTMPEDPDAYYKALTDPNATVKTNDFLTSVTKGFLDSYGNMDRWEEGAIGFLTGILGMPTFGTRANSDSNTYLGRGKMVGLSGGFFGEFSNANYLNRLGAESVKNINAFRDKYKQHAQFLAQSQAFTDAMDGYLQDKNEFAYNNARDNDDYAMIQALAVTGRIDEVKAMLNFKEEDLTDDILDSIANDFTENSNLVDSDGNPKTVDDNGKPLQGAWRDKAGNLMSRTGEGKAEMKAKLLKKQKRLNEEIDDYVSSLDSVRAQVNNSLDESQVRELAWLDWKNKQWSRRFQDVQEDQNEAFKTISSAITQALDAKDKNGNPVYTDKDTINKLKELQELADKAVSAKSPMELYTLSALDGNLLHKLYAKVKGEKFDYDVFDIISNYIGDNNLLNTIFESLYDIRQMALAQHQFSEKLKEYTSDPSKLAANRQRIEEERQQAQSVTDDINTRRKLKNMSVKDYMGLSDEDKEKVKAQAKDFDDDDINNIIVYGDDIDEKTEKMLNEVFGDEDTDETTKSLLAEAIAAMKDEAEKPEQITIHSEAYLEWRRNKLNEYKNNGKYDEGLEYLNGLDEYLLRLMSDYSDDDSDFEDEDFDDGEPEDFDDEDAPSVDDFDDDDSTGHDATTSVQSVREKQKKDKKKEEKKKKKEEELTYADELWKRLTDIAPEGKEEVVESTAKPIREKLEKTANDEIKKGVKKIASGVVTTLRAGIFPSDSYKELEQIIGDKALLEKTIIGIINDYIEYINGILAKEVADNKAVIEGDNKKAEEPEEEVRTPVIPESEIDTYAETQHKNRSGVGRDTQKNYWLPRTTQYGIGSTEFSKPKFDENGRQLKYWERVKENEGNYSPKLRAKIVTVGQWLDEHGVFDNVDGALNKTLKGGERGTEIAFTTNQELNDLVADAMWEADNKQGEKPKPVIILMAVGDDLHIVGDIAEPDLKNLGTQEKHLAAFVNDFNKRYGEWLGDSNQDHSKPFVHPMRTKVHQGLVGRMIYNEKKDRNTLNSIFGNGIILGVALRDSDSGKLDVITNPNKSKKDAKTSMENDILQPQNPKAGQPYVVVPSLVSGKYICVPFTIPSLSEVRRIEGHENFGLIRNLNDALAEIASIDFTKDNVDTELIAAKDKLESILNVNLWVEYKDGKLIIKRKVDKKYVQIYAEPVENMRNFAESIITEFANAGVGFQVDRKKINKGDYNRLIGEIANTNLPVGTEYHTKNDWFTVEPINVESGKRDRIASNIKSTGNNPNASDKIITVTRTAKDKSVTVTVDLENDTVSYTDSKGKLQVVPKSEFGTKENAHKAWAYAIGQAKEIFKDRPNKNTLPYQTKNNDEYFDPVNYRFLASKEEFDDLCKKRSTLPKAVDTLEADLKKSVGKDITVTITTKSKSGYPIVEIQRTDGENGVYTNKFRVSEEGNIESAAGWASDNPANWEVDNSVTNRGGDTISFTPVLDFYKTLGFTPKPAPTTTTQTTTEQQPTVETKQSAYDFKQEEATLEKQIEGFTREEKAAVKADIIRRLNKSLNGSGHMYNPNNPQVLTADDVTIILDKETRAKLVMATRESKKAADAFARAIIEDAISEVEANVFSNVADYTHGNQLDVFLHSKARKSEQQSTTPQVSEQAPSTEQEQKEQIKEDFDDSFDVEEASPEVEQAIGEVIQGTNLGLSIDEVFKQNSNLEQLYNSNPQFKDSVDSLRKAMEENKQREEEQKAKEQQIAEEPAKTPDDIVEEYLEKAKDPEYRRIWKALSDEGKKKFATNYAKDSKTFNSKMREIKKFWNRKEGKFTLGGEPKFRVETRQDTTKWNREQETAWLKKALPQLSNEQRVQVVDGLIKIADSDNPGYAWGQFYRGLITISSEAASGTLYHEAFHAVIDLLMTEDEYNKLFDAAYQVWGNLGMLGLEEKLAEEFRKFVQYGDNAAFVDYDAEDIKTPIIRGIVRLFRRLKALIQGLSNKQIYLNKLFYDINKGKFADRKIKENKLDKVTTRQEEDAQLVLDRNPELASVGTAREYAAYINDIFPNSVEKDIYWHGSNEDFSDGFNTAKRGEGSGALETKKRNDLYLNRQGWASLQYVNGINRTGSDKNGFAHWNKLWWELKEIMSNGRRENNDWKDIVITDKDVNSIRQAIPNKRGKFDRDKGGTHGKWLKERKADYGYENKSDKEFFEEVFGLQLGKDTFNTWTARNAEVFKAMETTAKGIYPVVINVTNPIVEEGQNTYYEEQRGLFSQADKNGNDAILSRRADNEFNSDVAVVINANNKNVHWLGTKSDVEQFRQWKAKNVKQPKFDINERELEDIKKRAIADGTFMKAPNGKPTNLNERQWLQVRTKAFKEWFGDWINDPENASKVVDENGEPLVVWHSTDKQFTEFDSHYETSEEKEWRIWRTDTEEEEKEAKREIRSFFTSDKKYAESIFKYKHPDTVYVDENNKPVKVVENSTNMYMYGVFLNIKNPLYTKRPLELNELRSIESIENYDNTHDGIIGHDLYDVETEVFELKKSEGTEYVAFKKNQIKSATDNVGTFSRENNDIRYREVITNEEEYKSIVEEIGLSRDSADTFIYNFMTKILNVNPRYKVNEKSDTLSYFYLDDPTIINQQGKARIENLFKKILGKSQGEYLPLDFDSREAFIKSIDEFLADWEQSLIQRVNNPSGNSAYKEKAQTLRKIKLLQSLLNRNLDLSTFTEEEKELIGSIEGKSKKNIGFAIQKLKRQLPVIEQQIERINFINHAMLVQAKNRLLAIHTIENIEDIIKDRLLREYDSYTIKDNTYNEKVLPNRKVVEAVKKVLEQKHREGATVLFDEKESRNSDWNELYNRIVTSYPEYKELLDLFHKANPKLKIVVGGNAEMTVQGSELGKFHPKSNTLYLTNESDIFTAIHELAHSATFYGMKGKSKDTESFDSSINKFMDYIREYIKDIQANPALFSNSSVWEVSMPADIYGFTNASEFIAELFGNPSFQELLDTIPAMEESKFKSLLQQVWDMIAEFLNKVFGNNRLSKSALDQAKQLGYVSMSLQEQHIDLIYKQLEKYTNKAQPSISRVKTDDMSVKQYHFQKLMYVNLSEEDKEYIKERGMSVRDYSSMSQAEKELFWRCR